MSEIRFRAWDKEAKQFLHDIQNEWGGADGDYPPFPFYIDNKNFVVEQYTGIKDKNDEKIYEGDIVIYKNGFKYYVEWSEINAMWCLVQIRTKLAIPYTGGINGQDIHRCEVIGNLHENPELMK